MLDQTTFKQRGAPIRDNNPRAIRKNDAVQVIVVAATVLPDCGGAVGGEVVCAEKPELGHDLSAVTAVGGDKDKVCILAPSRCQTGFFDRICSLDWQRLDGLRGLQQAADGRREICGAGEIGAGVHQ